MEPAPIVMVMGQGKEAQGGEGGREQRATSASAARAVMMGMNWDFI